MELSLKLCPEVALPPAGWNGGRLVLVNVETTFSPLSLRMDSVVCVMIAWKTVKRNAMNKMKDQFGYHVNKCKGIRTL